MLKKALKTLFVAALTLIVLTSVAYASEVEKFSDEWYAQEYGEYGFSTKAEYYGSVDLVAKFADKKVPDVRVNGHIVEFPDGQPYIDENNRTMIPVRFVAEQMGAEVSWDQSTKTASISKNGITVKITIGKKDIQVIENGTTKTVAMDTVAVNNSGRTYVPIRYVAEALGAYVDYSTTCKTVGIYNDVLTSEQIEFLLSLGYASVEQQYTERSGYANRGQSMESSKALKYFGTDRESFEGNFANAREHVYRSTAYWVSSNYKFPESGLSLNSAWSNGNKVGEYRTTAEFIDMVLEEVRATYEYDCTFFSSEVFTDASCVYQGDDWNSEFLVRMIVKYTPKIPNPARYFMSEDDISHLDRLHLWDTATMDTQYIVLDALVGNRTSEDKFYCLAALSQTPNLSKEACRELGFEGGSDITWSEDSNYSDYVYELDDGRIGSYYKIISSRNIWVIDEAGNGSWKTVDILDYSTQLIENDFDETGLTDPVEYYPVAPTQYRKVVAADGTVSYQFGQWQTKYVYSTDEGKEFFRLYDIVVWALKGKSSTTVERWENGEWSRVTYYAKDYPTAAELMEEYCNGWTFVPGGYTQNSSGQWVFQPS